jgi:hypothetical protein
MSEQKEAAALPQCYLVTLEVEYEEPTIIKGFGILADAEAFQAELEAYQEARPEWPADDAPKEEWSSFPEAREAWLNAHPGGRRATGADKFCIVAVPFVPQSEPVFAIPCRKFPNAAVSATACRSDCPCGQSRVVGGYQTDEIKPAGHNPARATPYDSDAKPYDATLPRPRNLYLSVDLPAFDGYQAHIVRELQAAFVKACENVNIKVKSPEVKS